MRLRSSINPPQRYESDAEFLLTDYRRTPRRAAKTQTKNYVEFNPHLPPAAFPTLDQPLPAGQSAPPPLPSSSKRQEDDYNQDSAGLDPFSHIPQESFDNFIASNGPQNPQYVRNMALLDKECSSDIVVSSDEDEDELQLPGSDAIGDYHDEEQKIPDDPQWHDLSLGLQIEIAENMLEIHEMSKVRFLLGLNQFDVEELKRNLNKRNADVEYENSVLEEMQRKQLKALMCLDNSDLRNHSVPARLIMSRKSWTQCHRVIQRNSRMRYLLCQVGDLQTARRFLSRRGLPMTYAGEWDNQFVTNPSVSNLEGVPEAFEWRPATNQSTYPTAVTRDDKSEGPETLVETQLGVPNAHSSTVDNSRDDHLSSPRQENHIPALSTQQRPSDGYSQIELPRQSLVRLKIGARNAAHIQTYEPPTPYSHPSDIVNVMFTRSLPQPIIQEPNSDDTIEQSPPKPNRSFPIQGHFPLPVRRKFGRWSNDEHRPRPALSPTSESRENQICGNFPQSPKSALNEPVLDRHAADLASRDILQKSPRMEPYSSSGTEAIANIADKNKTSAETTFATPDSSDNAVHNVQLRSDSSAYEDPSSLPGNEPSINMHSNSTSFSNTEHAAHQLKLKQTRESQELIEKTDTGDVTEPMAKGGLRPSTLPQDNAAEVPSEEEPEASSPSFGKECSVSGDQSELGIITHNIPRHFAGLPTMQQQQSPMRVIDPVSSTEDQNGIQEAGTVLPYEPNLSNNQEMQSTDNIDADDGKEPMMTEVPRAQMVGPSAPTDTSNESDAIQAVEEKQSGNISKRRDNLTVEIPPLSIKTRQTTNKERAAGKKRNASNDSLASQPKRNKKSDYPVAHRVLRPRPAVKNEQKK